MPAKSKATNYADNAALDFLGLFDNLSVIRKAKLSRTNRFDWKNTERQILTDLFPHQRHFVEDFSHKYCGFSGGYGSGKTYAAVCKGLLHGFRSQGFTHIFMEPTIPLLRDIAIPTWNEILEKYNIPYSFRGFPLPNYVLHLPGGDTHILLRSIETFERIVGINAASLVADEIDTVKHEIAAKAMIKLQGRVRVGNCPQICTASTPEGYKFHYSFYVENKSDDKVLYKGKSKDNPFLDPGYVADLESKYPPALVKAYLEGEFVNLETATVFYQFSRERHNSQIFSPERGEQIFIGSDFNVKQCCSVYAVVRETGNGQRVEIFAESKVNDTYAMVEHIRSKFPYHLSAGMVNCFPDASGAHESTSSTQTDHDILRAAGIKVIAPKRNPPIAETVAHVNMHLYENRVAVNSINCPEVARCFEQWGYDENFKPRKGGTPDHSHFGDGLRYLIFGVLPKTGFRQGPGPRWR